MSHVGRVRSRNEDAYLVRLDPQAQGGLFAVADGLGGHAGGDVASALAIETLEHRWQEGVKESPLDWLEQGVREAHHRIRQRAQEEPSLADMGTTLTLLLIQNHQGYLAHVGDSRAYRLRAGQLERLTRDHTLVATYVAAGLLSPEAAQRHPYRSILEQALGVAPGLEVDRMSLDLLPGDRFLLCSDGLTDMLPDPTIAHLLQSASIPEAACRALIEAANEAGGADNITTVVVDCRDTEGPV